MSLGFTLSAVHWFTGRRWLILWLADGSDSLQVLTMKVKLVGTGWKKKEKQNTVVAYLFKCIIPVGQKFPRCKTVGSDFCTTGLSARPAGPHFGLSHPHLSWPNAAQWAPGAESTMDVAPDCQMNPKKNYSVTPTSSSANQTYRWHLRLCGLQLEKHNRVPWPQNWPPGFWVPNLRAASCRQIIFVPLRDNGERKYRQLPKHNPPPAALSPSIRFSNPRACCGSVMSLCSIRGSFLYGITSLKYDSRLRNSRRDWYCISCNNSASLSLSLLRDPALDVFTMATKCIKNSPLQRLSDNSRNVFCWSNYNFDF